MPDNSKLFGRKIAETDYRMIIYIFIIDIHYISIFVLYTRSTARGGGGSFKNRKRIGEIGCCESPMAEQKH